MMIMMVMMMSPCKNVTNSFLYNNAFMNVHYNYMSRVFTFTIDLINVDMKMKKTLKT